jgi:hypothetical protein
MVASENPSKLSGGADMWNTGCNVVYNRTDKRLIYIVDGEDQSRTLLVPPEDEASFRGTILSWANSDEEVTRKSFRVQYYVNNKLKGWFYIFQDYSTDLACWVDWTSASPYQEGRANAASFKASYVDMQIDVKPDDEGNLTLPVVEFIKV